MAKDDAREKVNEQVQDVVRDVFGADSERILEEVDGVEIGPQWLKRIEEESMALAREESDARVGRLLEEVVGLKQLERSMIGAARDDAKRNGGLRLKYVARREKGITLLGGSELRLESPYLRKDLSKRPGPTRGTGKRGKAGNGLYPVLSALGIEFGVTPAAAFEITREVVSSESVRVARKSLERRSLDLGHGAVLRVVNKVGGRFVEQHDDWIDQQLEREPPALEDAALAGKRVALAVDGGRVRLRKPNAGRPKSNGHRNFRTPWAEPKQLCIYTLDDDGEMDRSSRCVLDGTLGDADAIFKHAKAYLLELGAAHAKELTVLGDGALWIWGRIDELVEAVGIDPERVHLVLDTYHGRERITEIVDKFEFEDEAGRKRFRDMLEGLLLDGEPERLIAILTALDTLNPGHGFDNDVAYFDLERIDYATHRAEDRPVGSGAVESAIRRVINLRIKATSKFWLEENAEHMLRMRSFLKAGRFEDMFAWSTAKACEWWQPAPPLLGVDARRRRGRYEQAA